jgi:Fe-S cluster biogenesis protein NfuA
MLHGHGGNVELLGITDGVVHLHLQGSCHGCPSSAATVRQTIEEAIFARAPEILAIKVDGMVDPLPRGKIALPLVGG